MEFCFVLLNTFYYFLTTKGYTLPKDLASDCIYKNICALGAQYYADPYDCNSFIHCSNGIPYRKKCAIPLYWNQNRLTCQWSNDHCGEQINSTTGPLPPTTLKPTPTLEPIVANETTSGISIADIPLSTSLPEVFTTGHNRPESSTSTLSQVSSTTTAQRPSPSEVCEEGRVIASELCEYYYQCFNGKHRIMKCPQGSYWNQQVIACTIDNSGCLETTTFITTSEVHLSTNTKYTNNSNTEIATKTTSEISEIIIDKSTDGISVTSESTTIIITADGETTSEGTTSEDRTENSFTLAPNSFNASTMNSKTLWTTLESKTSEITAGTPTSSERSKSTQYTTTTVPQYTERSTIETGEISDDGEISNATTFSSAGSSTESTVHTEANESTESGTTTNKTTKSDSSTERTNIETIANEITSNTSFSETKEVTASVPTSEAMTSIASTETPTTQITNDLSTNATMQSTIVTMSNICQNTKTEYHTDTNNCTQFIECISGQAHIQSCPELYHWDAEQALCIKGSCPQMTILPEDSYTTEEIKTTSSVKVITLTPNICTSNLREYHTFPDNCTKFIECVDGIAYEVICPQYYYWDEEEVSCVFGVCLRNITFS